MFTTAEFPFPYQIRVSKRAKRLNLNISSEKGVQVVIPRFTSKKEALAFLRKHVSWIEKNAHIWQQQSMPPSLPQRIDLSALNTTWTVHYETNVINKRAALLERPNNTLVYFGKDEDALKQKKLQQWSHKKAASHLSTRLRELSEDCQLPFNNISFRSQRTRWGSCSHEKNISLNYKLIFIEPHLVDYILIHELVHTIHLNHGKRFWALVAKHVTNYKECMKQLRNVKTIPNWF